MFKSVKRDLLLCAVITAFVLFCALLWGSPFVGNATSTDLSFLGLHHARSTILQGTVVRDGARLVLLEVSGPVFYIDNPQEAQSFADKSVTITGQLEATSKTIHIERIALAA